MTSGGIWNFDRPDETAGLAFMGVPGPPDLCQGSGAGHELGRSYEAAAQALGERTSRASRPISGEYESSTGSGSQGSPGRQALRRFLGRWLDNQLLTGPDAELRRRLLEQLARQGWQLRPDDSMMINAEPVRGIPVSAPFLRTSRLHPLVEAEARDQFLNGKPELGVFASMKAVEIRVRKLAGLGDEVIGTNLMNKSFGPGGHLTDPTAGRGEQEATRALFAGAYGVLRNPAGHRQVDYADLSEAAEAVQTASLLMRMLDRVEDRLLTSARATATAPAP